jgi:hypothetical protein
MSLERATNPLKPFSVVLQPFIDEIGEKERAVKEVANMANMEMVKGMTAIFPFHRVPLHDSCFRITSPRLASRFSRLHLVR